MYKIGKREVLDSAVVDSCSTVGKSEICDVTHANFYSGLISPYGYFDKEFVCFIENVLNIVWLTINQHSRDDMELVDDGKPLITFD